MIVSAGTVFNTMELEELSSKMIKFHLWKHTGKRRQQISDDCVQASMYQLISP